MLNRMITRRAAMLGACAAVPAIALARRALALATDAKGDVDPALFKAADEAINDAIEKSKAPGAVLCAGRKSGIVYLKAYGNRAVKPSTIPMTDDTIFDMASLTKPLACATSAMLLIERGKLAVSDLVTKYFPDFEADGKGTATVEHLLLHRSGVIPDNPIGDYENVSRDVAVQRMMRSKRKFEPGTGFEYSDVGFMTLGEIVSKVAGRPINEFAHDELFKPLGMVDSGYLPADALKPRCAPTEMRDGHWMIGEVHDPRAFALGGVAGHAGLFSTARDVSRYCRMILGKGELEGVRVMKESTIETMTTPHALPDGKGVRTYGFDVDTGYSSPRGNRFPKGKSFGHTGFTGTSLWIDPQDDAFVILLTNSVHPDGASKKVVELRREVGTAVAEALLDHKN
jgi:CubicO group peptidase (beta-lactamase class C family)